MWAPDTITFRPEVLIYLLNLAVVASLLCGASLLVARVCRKYSAPFRYNLLASSLVLTLLGPWAAWIGQEHGPGILEVSVSSQTPEAASSPAQWTSITNDVTRRPTQHPGMQAPGPHFSEAIAPRTASENRLAINWWNLAGTIAVFAWAVGIGIGAFWLARSYRAMARLRRTLKPIVDPRLAVLACEASDALRLHPQPPILASTQVPAPISLGVWRPVIILPPDVAQEMEDSQLSAVLLHEMAHITRRDHLAGLVQRLAVILFWWNPLVRVLNNRIAELREEICDNHVLSIQGGGKPLASVLVDMADRALVGPRLPMAVGIHGAKRNGLGKRITRLIEKEPNMATQVTRVCSAFIFLFSLAVLLGIASVGSLQAAERDADQQKKPAAKKKSSERRARNLSKQSGQADVQTVYQADFSEQKFDHGMLVPYGFETLYGLQLLKPEARGLRVTIPHHQGTNKLSVGVLPLMTLGGDFEITATCELLGTEPPEHNFAAGAGIYIMAQDSLNGAVLRRGVRPNGEHVYLVNCMIRDDEGKRNSKIKFFPAENRTGQLRLARQGTTLQILIAEENSDQFRKLHEAEFGADTIGLVRLETTTEGSPTTAEALWKDLTIRATELVPVSTPLFGSPTGSTP